MSRINHINFVSTYEIFSDSSTIAVREEQSARLRIDIVLDIISGKKPLESRSNGEIYSFDISCTLSSADRWSRRTSDKERIGVGCSNEKGCECRSEIKQNSNIPDLERRHISDDFHTFTCYKLL